MHPSISQFPNEQFYHGKIIDGPSVIDHHNSYLDGGIYGSYSFIHIEDGKEEQSGWSLKNMVEAAVAGNIVYRLEKGTLNTPTFE
jgi:senataxin